MADQIRLGDLTERIAIERDATVKSPSGGTKAWTTPETVVEVWAKIEPLGAGREIYGNPQWVISLGAYRIWILRRNDLSEKMRIAYREPSTSNMRYFSIHSIPLSGPRQNFVALMCQEIK